MSAPLQALPTISVCIPTYNGGEPLRAAIQSVMAQTWRDFELVVIDDGSTDATPAIVAGFDDPRVRYLRNPRNLGPQGNWNRCLAEARGQYFKLLPHDDVLHRECLERQLRVLQSDATERLALVFSSREVIGPGGRVLTRRGYPGAREGVIPARDVIAACVRRGTNLLGEPGALLMRKALVNRVGPFDATNPYVIDLDYWFRLLAHGDAYYCDAPLASFRVWPQSWSVEIGADQGREFRQFIARAAPHVRESTSWLDRALGRLTPGLNNLGRLAFYRLYVR
jgi:glycosyltransferase involved in cell wall biosynthesis